MSEFESPEIPEASKLRLGTVGEPAWPEPKIEAAFSEAIDLLRLRVSHKGLTPFGFMLYLIIRDGDEEARERLWLAVAGVLGEIAQGVPVPVDFPTEEFTQDGLDCSTPKRVLRQRRIDVTWLESAFESVLASFEGTGQESHHEFFARCWPAVQASLLEGVGLPRPFPFSHLLGEGISRLTVKCLKRLYVYRIYDSFTYSCIEYIDDSMSSFEIRKVEQPGPGEESEVEKELREAGYYQSMTNVDRIYTNDEVRSKHSGQTLAIYGDDIWGAGADADEALRAACKVEGCPPREKLNLVSIPPLYSCDMSNLHIPDYSQWFPEVGPKDDSE